MINCPKCGGLNPQTSMVCGACGASLEGINNNISTDVNNTNISNPGLFMYEENSATSPVKVQDVKNTHAGISIWHIVLFIASICSWVFIPIRLAKLGIAFVLFYVAENSNRKNSVFLILVRIVTAIQIIGIVIALALRVFVSVDAMNTFFQYFKF